MFTYKTEIQKSIAINNKKSADVSKSEYFYGYLSFAVKCWILELVPQLQSNSAFKGELDDFFIIKC